MSVQSLSQDVLPLNLDRRAVGLTGDLLDLTELASEYSVRFLHGLANLVYSLATRFREPFTHLLRLNLGERNQLILTLANQVAKDHGRLSPPEAFLSELACGHRLSGNSTKRFR